MKKQSFWPVLGLALFLSLHSCTPPESTVPAPKSITDAVFASGYTERENNYTVSAKVDGIILTLPVVEGDSVRTDALIAVVENDVQNNQLADARAVYQDAQSKAAPNSPQLQSLQTQIDQAQQQLAFDRENFQRYRSLWEKKSVAQLEFEKAELQFQSAQNNLRSLEQQYRETQDQLQLNLERSRVQVSTQRSLLRDYELRTEASGRVIQVFKKQGELARRGEALAQIASGDYLIRLFISEDDITKVNLGQSVAVQLYTSPNRTYPARVSKIYPAFDEAEQSYIDEARFEEQPAKMFSGTQLQANIKTGNRKNVLVIPTEYLSRGNVVQLESGEEKQIETGSKNQEWTEVVSGITQRDVLLKPQ